MSLNHCVNDGLVVSDDGFCPNCNAYYSQWNTRDNPPAPMTRREEVGQMITVHKRFIEAEKMENPARCVDELSVQMERLARTIADEVDARDTVITKLLAMLEPGVSPSDNWCAEAAWEIKAELYARACEIAGRVK